jgi:hypothetical protein
VNPFLDAALGYARRGWRVFPCKPRMKQPLTAHGFKDATTDLDQIRRWWKITPASNIATPTGLAFDVVDFDHLDLYEQARDAQGLEGPQVRTARGAHFYVAPTGRSCTKLTASIDFKARGGYVLLPESLHPSGARYRWIARGEPQPAPDWLRTLLSEPRTGTDGAARAARSLKSNLAPGQTRRPTARGVAWLRAMAERLATEPEGNRNHFLNWCAFRAQDIGVDQSDVEIVLRDAALTSGLDEREIEQTLTSAFKRWT